jgi:hypothetical protein
VSSDNKIENVMRDCHDEFHKQDRAVQRPATAREAQIEATRQRGRAIINASKGKKKS